MQSVSEIRYIYLLLKAPEVIIYMGLINTHDDAKWRHEDADREADADPAEEDEALLPNGEKECQEDDEPKHPHVQEQHDLRREQLMSTYPCQLL
jgi:hypothetical protein